MARVVRDDGNNRISDACWLSHNNNIIIQCTVFHISHEKLLCTKIYWYELWFVNHEHANGNKAQGYKPNQSLFAQVIRNNRIGMNLKKYAINDYSSG